MHSLNGVACSNYTFRKHTLNDKSPNATVGVDLRSDLNELSMAEDKESLQKRDQYGKRADNIESNDLPVLVMGPETLSQHPVEWNNGLDLDDEDIVEVPVPPKPIPEVIDLTSTFQNNTHNDSREQVDQIDIQSLVRSNDTVGMAVSSFNNKLDTTEDNISQQIRDEYKNCADDIELNGLPLLEIDQADLSYHPDDLVEYKHGIQLEDIDSDEDVVEVPVPPKPIPEVIDLTPIDEVQCNPTEISNALSLSEVKKLHPIQQGSPKQKQREIGNSQSRTSDEIPKDVGEKKKYICEVNSCNGVFWKKTFRCFQGLVSHTIDKHGAPAAAKLKDHILANDCTNKYVPKSHRSSYYTQSQQPSSDAYEQQWSNLGSFNSSHKVHNTKNGLYGDTYKEWIGMLKKNYWSGWTGSDWKCECCGQRFPEVDDLLSHVMTDHKNAPGISPGRSSEHTNYKNNHPTNNVSRQIQNASFNPIERSNTLDPRYCPEERNISEPIHTYKVRIRSDGTYKRDLRHKLGKPPEHGLRSNGGKCKLQRYRNSARLESSRKKYLWEILAEQQKPENYYEKKISLQRPQYRGHSTLNSKLLDRINRKEADRIRRSESIHGRYTNTGVY